MHCVSVVGFSDFVFCVLCVFLRVLYVLMCCLLPADLLSLILSGVLLCSAVLYVDGFCVARMFVVLDSILFVLCCVYVYSWCCSCVVVLIIISR